MVTRPNPLKKDKTDGDITRKTSFGQLFSQLYLSLFKETMKTMKLDYYTKKLITESFLKLMLFAQLQGSDSLYDLSDALLDDDYNRT